MEYRVSKNININWNAKGSERIVQNVYNLLNTFRYEVAYNRILGRNPANLEKPVSDMIPLVIAETYELITEYEPRATIIKVEVVGVEEGDPTIEVVIRVGE
jgi:phage baseplate assembly protein W